MSGKAHDIFANTVKSESDNYKSATKTYVSQGNILLQTEQLVQMFPISISVDASF